MAATSPALAPPPAPARPRVLLIATAFVAAAAAMALLALVGVYLAERADVLADPRGVWFPEEASLPLTPPNMSAVTLLMSSVTIQWAVYAIGNDDRTNANVAMGLTLVFGFAYLNSATYLLSQLNLGVAESLPGLLIHAIGGMHVALVAAAMIFVVLMAFRTLGGQYSSRDREGVAAAALFWHVTVALYLVIWYAVYITK